MPRSFCESYQWVTGTPSGTVENMLGIIRDNQVCLMRDLGPLCLHQDAFLLYLPFSYQVDTRAQENTDVFSCNEKFPPNSCRTQAIHLHDSHRVTLNEKPWLLGRGEEASEELPPWPP